MYRFVPETNGNKAIRNIIFDFGGVICDLDIPLTEKKFQAFGMAKQSDPASTEASGKEFDRLVEYIEMGKITPDQFRIAIREHYLNPPTDEAIDDAWNAMLLPIPRERIVFLEELRKHYRIFLLSNSNKIHYDQYIQDFRKQTGYNDFNGLFEKAYFSYKIGLKKPGEEIFRFVLRDCGLDPSESVFIDDTLENVKGAEAVGINGCFLKKGQSILDLFLPY